MNLQGAGRTRESVVMHCSEQAKEWKLQVWASSLELGSEMEMEPTLLKTIFNDIKEDV